MRELPIAMHRRRRWADDLAVVYEGAAGQARAVDDHRGAETYYSRAIAILAPLVDQEGRHELAFALGRTKADRGDTLIALGEKVEGLEDLRSARPILQAEFLRTGQDEVKQFLGWVEQQIAENLPSE
jgi:hypothetical protein